MRTVTIDLNSNPEIKDLVVDMQPGDKIDLHASIKAVDEQTLTLTIDEAEKGKDDSDDEENDEDSTAAAGDSEENEDGGGQPGQGY